MRSIRYLLLLGLCGGTGVALAVALATGSRPSADVSPSESKEAVLRTGGFHLAPAGPVVRQADETSQRTAASTPPPSTVAQVAPPHREQVKLDSALPDPRKGFEGVKSPSKATGLRKRAATATPEPRRTKRDDAPPAAAVAVKAPEPMSLRTVGKSRNSQTAESALDRSSPDQEAAPMPLMLASAAPAPTASATGPHSQKPIANSSAATGTAATPPPVALPPLPTPEPVPTAPPEPIAAPTKSDAKDHKPKSQISVHHGNGEGDDKLSMQFADEDIHAVLDSLAAQGNLNILTSKNVSGKVSARLNQVDLDTALQAILRSTGYVARREGDFIFVGTLDDFNSMEQAVDRVGTRVYRPNYVTAADLQALIQPLVTEKIGAVSVTSPAEVGMKPEPDNGGGNKFSGGDVVLVRDYQAVLEQIDQVVAEIDVRPMQVAIEAMILSVKLDDSDKFGVNFQFLRDKNNIKFGIGNPPETLANFKFEDGALKFGFLDSSLGAFLSALETVGQTNVIATPRLMALNKQKADILIGEQLGYVSTTVTETASTQSVAFLDVGAQLRLRPFISPDGLIRMEVHPELSTGTVTTQNGFTLPNKELTQVTTNIMVRDGCTVVIGGLMRDDLETTMQQVPYMGNLPWIGFLFRQRTEKVQRREILVLITPHIVYEPETCREGDEAACDFHRRHAVVAEKMTPVGRHHVARRYTRIAQNAWAAGDRSRAMRFAEMAVQFDPNNRQAIELRTNIWQGQPVSQRGPILPDGAITDGMLDSQQMPDWLLSNLEQSPAVQPPLHPLDPGQPGRHQDIVKPRKFQ